MTKQSKGNLLLFATFFDALQCTIKAQPIALQMSKGFLTFELLQKKIILVKI